MVHKEINREALAGRLKAEHVLRLHHEPDQTYYEDDLFLIHAPHGGHALGYHLVRHWSPLYHAPARPWGCRSSWRGACRPTSPTSTS
jgi:hypothetical protein